MTVRRGEEWGAPGPLAAWAPVAATDHEAAAALDALATTGRAVPEVGLLGGDLHRTLGAPRRGAQLLHAGDGVRLPVDLIEVVLDLDDGTTERRTGLAHLVGRGRALFAGRTWVVMNAAFVGTANLCPRAHPGDGRLDLLDAVLPWRDRGRARRRAVTGTHVPHPAITERRVTEVALPVDGSLRWFLDGVALPAPAAGVVRVRPGAAVVVV